MKVGKKRCGGCVNFIKLKKQVNWGYGKHPTGLCALLDGRVSSDGCCDSWSRPKYDRLKAAFGMNRIDVKTEN